MNERKYTCAECGGVFRTSSAWSEREALAEYQTNFGDEPREIFEDTAEVCDVCYEEVLKRKQKLDEYRLSRDMHDAVAAADDLWEWERKNQ